MKRTRQLTQREVLLGAALILIIGMGFAVRGLFLPLYRQWRDLRQRVQLQEMQYQRLNRNMGLRHDVENQFARLDPRVFQRDSDEVTLGEWLRDLEAAARNTAVTPLNMRPYTMQSAATTKTYGVRVSISGRLPEVVRFVDEVSGSGRAVSLDACSIRGIPGGNNVECTLSLQLISLLDSPTRDNAPRVSARPKVE